MKNGDSFCTTVMIFTLFTFHYFPLVFA